MKHICMELEPGMLAHQYALLTRMRTYGMEYVFFFFVCVVLAYHVIKLLERHRWVFGGLCGHY